MNVLKESGGYLQEKAESNKNRAMIFFLIGGLGLLFSFLLEAFGLIYIFAISLGLAAFFFKSYINYISGDEGEAIVAQYLENLDDQYFLINDLKLSNGYGNIDHIVLGPNGIFVIETKNFQGQVRCEGDSWYQYKPEWKIPEEHEIKSPSKQVRGNLKITC